MAQTIIKALWDFFLTCPLMDGKKINVDYLPDSCRKNGIEYSIDAVPGTDVIESYISGSSMRQYAFVVQSVTEYGSDVMQNLDNSGFFEALKAWMEQKTKQRQLPILPHGQTARMIQADSTVYMQYNDENTGKYQIQCKLVYFQKGER